MKKLSLLILSAFLVLALISGCTNNPTNNSSSNNSDSISESTEPAEIVFAQYYQQYADNMKRFEEIFNEENPDIKLKTETYGDDFFSILKARIASGQTPDVFATHGYTQVRVYSTQTADLSNEPFWDSIEPGFIESVLVDGKKMAFPLNVQAYGFLYNKDIFEAAGIEKLPETLSEFEAVCAKLKAYGVTPYGAGFKDKWISDQISFYPYGYPTDVEEIFSDLTNKEAKLLEMEFAGNILNMLEVIKNNMQEKPFDTDFPNQCGLLAEGTVAMISQGDWAEPVIKSINADINIGIMGIPVSEDPEDTKVYSQASIVLNVSKDSKHLDAAKALLNWIATSQSAKDFFAKDMKIMTSIKNTVPEDSQIMDSALDYIQRGQIARWGMDSFPVGLDLTGPNEEFLMGLIDKQTALERISELWENFDPAE